MSNMRKVSYLLCVFVFIGFAFVAYTTYETHLFRSRGYGLLLHPDVPGLRASSILRAVAACLEQARDSEDDTRQVYDPANLALASSPMIIDKKLVRLSCKGESSGMYLYESKGTKLQFLAGSEVEFEYCGDWFKILVCSYGVNKKSSDKYLAYYDYPEEIQKRFNTNEWQKWAVLLVREYLFITDRVFSTVPPIPGCLVLLDRQDRSKSKIYYPESILPDLYLIYPDVNIPEEQILREATRGD